MFFLFACSCYKKKEPVGYSFESTYAYMFSNDKKFSVTVLMYQY